MKNKLKGNMKCNLLLTPICVIFLTVMIPRELVNINEVDCEETESLGETVITEIDYDVNYTISPSPPINLSTTTVTTLKEAPNTTTSKSPEKKKTNSTRSQINPQNARHPEIPPRIQKQKPRQRLLPNLYQPINLPRDDYQYPSNPFYHFNPYQNLNIGLDSPEQQLALPNPYNPRYRSGVVSASGYQNLQPHYRAVGRGMYTEGSRVENRPRLVKSQNYDDDVGETTPKRLYGICGGACAENEFLCIGSCICIPSVFRCDGDPDCPGEEDELRCGEADLDVFKSCLGNDYVRCPRSGKCIRKSWLCDSEDDCGDFSDETHCDGRNCTETEFECSNGFCIQKSWLCDGDNDCKDYSDELNCTNRRYCEKDEFQCLDGNCISISWKCDGEPDCIDGSDEKNCSSEPHTCKDNEFECAYPRCVKKEFKCDGDNDCGDWSDEQNCTNNDSTCGPSEYKCKGGKCIPELWKCDKEIDCENGEDESDCTEKTPKTCGPDQFSCNNGNCILKTWVCDNIQDCSKGEDEENCHHSCLETQFTCKAHENETMTKKTKPKINCIGRKHVCDGKKDCPRGEDEKNCPKKVKCQSDTLCQQHCVVYPDGQDSCSCSPGFILSNDNVTCDDIDECKIESEPVCSQICNNTIGSFSCFCQAGYVLRPDGRTCKASGDPATLLFANRIDIRQVSLTSLQYKAILKGLQNAIAIDYHYQKGWIFWSDVSMDVIRRATISGTGRKDVINWGLESPGGIAVDWIHNLLFWTDSGTRRVEVSTLEGMQRSVIVSNDLDKPRAIAVHPGLALIFWTDWGPKPKIEVSEMDGGNRKSIVTEGVFWPNGLALDYTVDRVYWTDAKHHAIESAKLDGSDRKKIVSKGLPHPFAITVFEEAIYWTDWHTKSIASANKVTGSGYKIVHTGLHFPMDIQSFHSQRQPSFQNHCGNENGGCSHLCLPIKSSYKCICPLGLYLNEDKKTCTETLEKLLIFVRRKDIRLRPLALGKEAGIIDMVIPLDRIRSAAALEFDSNTNMIYWSDVESHVISRSRLNGSQQTNVINNNLKTPYGLAIDWVTKKLYWTDAGTNRIELSNLNGSLRSVVIWEDLDKPRDIVVDPIGGYMYFSDWGKSPKIERAGMDGSKRRILFNKDLIWPNGLVIDYEKSRLYWVDGGTKLIEFSNLDGTERTALKVSGTEIRHPFGLALYENKLFYTDWETNSIHFVDKDSGENGGVLRERISGLMDIRIFHRNFSNVNSSCMVDNGGCSHLCLLAPPPETYSCACPIGVKLLSDGKTCASSPTNALIVAHRVDIRRISLDMSYSIDTVLPLPSMQNTKGVDFDRKTGDIYWTDTTEDRIMKASKDCTRVSSVISDSLDTADGIAIDSAGRKIYWTDAGRNSIEVAELNGANRKVLIWTDLENPRAIVLHYHYGLMFWSDWGKKGRIEKANMNGRNRKVILFKDLEWPNGLAIDIPAERLYWNDGKRKTIESSDLKGQNRRVIVQEAPHPYGLVVVDNYIYWTDWKTQSVHRADKINGSDSQVISDRLEGLMDIQLIRAENVSENACGKNNGGCSHLCLRKPGGYSCECPSGILMKRNGKTCQHAPSSYLLLSTRNKLVRMSFDTPELWDVILPVSHVENSVAIDYHWKSQMIFYTDINLRHIRGINMNNLSDNVAIISKNLTTPDGLAVDWLAENLYWSDTGRKVLEVAKLNGSWRKIIIFDGLDEPRAVAVYASKGYLFWSDWGESPKIERSYMDGSGRRPIVWRNLGFPNGIAPDYTSNKLFWVDALKDKIEMSDLHGQNRVELIPEDTHPFGLTTHGNNIYWTDWYSKSVQKANKITGLNRVSIRSGFKSVMEIKAVSASNQVGWSPCQKNNGYCSHLCFFRKKDYVCGCPDLPDHRPCHEEPKEVVPFMLQDDDYTDLSKTGYGMKSELDRILEDPNINLGNSYKEELDMRDIAILTATAISALIIVIFVILLLIHFHRYLKKKEEKEMYDSQNVITFTNPNYSASENVMDKKPFLWRKLKYDKSQERIYEFQEELKFKSKGRKDRHYTSAPTTRVKFNIPKKN